jgi:catechol 2,3-dioxygenase-like lactoylglutathione lyase family enzyme
MSTHLALTTFLVPDYDSAIAFFTRVLGLDLVEDTDLGEGKRWVVVGQAGSGSLLIARATSPDQSARIGDQTGGRVGFFLHTDDLEAIARRLAAEGIDPEGPVRDESYGRVVVFQDPWGNRWDLIEPS